MEITTSLSNVHVFLPFPPPGVTSGTLMWLSLLNTNKTTFKSHYCLPDQVSSTRLAESCDTPFWNFPLASGQSLAQQKVPFFFSFVLSEAMPAEGSDSPMLFTAWMGLWSGLESLLFTQRPKALLQLPNCTASC